MYVRNVNEYHHCRYPARAITAAITITVEVTYKQRAKLAVQRWVDVDKACFAAQISVMDGWSEIFIRARGR